jgi:small subunit ribosomal protein S6
MARERLYELVLIIDPGLEDEKVEGKVKKIEERLTAGGGRIEEIARWGKRRLAYPIKKKESANYTILRFSSKPDQLDELERGIRLDEQILRHLIVYKGTLREGGQ